MIVAYFALRGKYGGTKHRYMRRAIDVALGIANQRIAIEDYFGDPLELEAELLFTPGDAPIDYSPKEFLNAVVELCESAPKPKDTDFKQKLKAWQPDAIQRLYEVSHGALV